MELGRKANHLTREYYRSRIGHDAAADIDPKGEIYTISNIE